MAVRTLRAILTAETSGLTRAFEESSLASKATADQLTADSNRISSSLGGVASSVDKAGFDKAGLVAGSELRTGVVSEADKAASDLEHAGTKGGDRFGKGVTSGMGKLGQFIENTVGIPVSQVGNKFSETGGKIASFSALGRTSLLGLGTAAAGFAAASVGSAVKFQNLTVTLAAQAGISATAANSIGTAFLSTAGHSVYSAAEMVTAYTGVASQLASVQGRALSSSQALGVMRSATDLAEASGLSLGAATQALATTMQVFHVRASGAANAANVLYQAGRQTGLGVTTLTGAFMRLHSQLGAVTPPLGQLGGLLVDLANHGETGRAAISGVSQAMTHLLKPASDVLTKVGEQKSSFDALSPVLQKLAEKYKTGALNSTQFAAATKGLSASQLTAISTYEKTRAALEAVDAKLATMPAGLQKLADQYRTGAITSSAFTTATHHLSLANEAMLMSWKATQDAAAKASVHLQALPHHIQVLAGEFRSGALSSEQFTKATTGLTSGQLLQLKAWQKTQDAVTSSQQKLRALGVTVDDSHGKFVGMANIIAQLHDKIQGETEAQKLATLTAAVGAGAAQRILTIVEAGPAAYARATAAVTKHNAAAEAAAKMNQSLQHQFEIVKVAVEDVAVKVGKVLVPMIEHFLGYLSSHMPVLIGFGVVIGTTIVAAITAYIGSLAVAAASTVLSVAKMVVSATAMSISYARVFLMQAAGWASSAAEAVAAGAIQIGVWVATAAAAAAAFIAENAATLGIAAGVALLVAGIIYLGTHWSQVWGEVKAIALDVWHFLDNVFHNGIVRDILEVISPLTLVLFHWRGVWGFIKQSALDVWHYLEDNLIHPLVDFFTKTIPDTFDKAVSFFAGLPGRFKSALGDIVGTVFHGLLAVADWFESHVLHPAVNWFAGLPGKLFTAVGDILTTVFHKLLGAGEWLTSTVLPHFFHWFYELPKTLFSAVGDITGQIFKGLENIGGWLDQHILKPALAWFTKLAGEAWKAFVGGVTPLTGEAARTARQQELLHRGPGRYPGHALGGITTGPTLGWIGEAGTEALIPLRELPKMAHDIMPAEAPQPPHPAMAMAHGGGDNHFHLHALTVPTTPAQQMAEFEWAMRKAGLAR